MKPTFIMYLIDESGNYYYAIQDPSGIDKWNVYYSGDPTPLNHLPKNWTDFKIQWVRNTDYWGVFRNQTSSLDFALDGRAILKVFLYGGNVDGTAYTGVTGMQAKLKLQIWRVNASDLNYRMIYEGNLNFAQAKDDVQNKFLTISMLDSNLREKLNAYASTPYNIPMWTTPDGGETWDLQTGLVGVNHYGIKLLFQQRFTIGATSSATIHYNLLDYRVYHSTIGPNLHTSPSMQPLNLVSANGSTSVVGNRILQNVFLVGTQTYEENQGQFQNFANNSYLFWNLLPNAESIALSAIPQFWIEQLSFPNPFSGYPSTFTINVYTLKNVSGNTVVDNVFAIGTLTMLNNPGYAVGATIVYNNIVFETLNNTGIPNDNNISSFPYITLTVFPSVSIPVCANQEMMAIGLVYQTSSSIPGAGNDIDITFNDLQFFFFSQPAYQGGGGAVRPAPQLNMTPLTGFRPNDLMNLLVPALFSSATDAYGFPITPVDYSGEYFVSDFMGDSSRANNDNWDVVPYDILFTSGNSLRDITGIDYISTSVSNIFKDLKNIFGIGLAIETDGGGTDYIRIEELSYFFDETTLLIDLGTNVFGISIEPLTTFAGNTIKTGNSQRQPNSDWGIDSFCVETIFNTPVTRVNNQIDMSIPDNADEYQIEYARAESNSKDQSSANSDNQTFIIHMDRSADETVNIYNPLGSAVVISGGNKPMQPSELGTVQNTDVTAASNPYIIGLLFPDTAINLSLSPMRCILRNGAYLASIFDGMGSLNLSFRKQYQLLFNFVNNSYTPEPYPSVVSNLQVGAASDAVTEASDVLIENLYSQWGLSTKVYKLFRPFLISVTTQQPINMYSIMGNNPKGYIKFTDPDSGIIYKGFIYDVEQRVGDQAATTFTLLATPDQTF